MSVADFAYAVAASEGSVAVGAIGYGNSLLISITLQEQFS